MPKSALGLILLLVASVSGQQPPRNPGGQSAAERSRTSALRQIIPGHYVYSSATYNSGIIVTGEGLVVLDALNSEAVARAQREAMTTTIRQPVRVLVSSTFHNNYSKGNIAYADVLKIGHEHYRTDLLDLMRREKVSAEEQTARLPNQTFRDRMTLYLGGKEIQILYVGRAHTRGDSIIYRSAGSHRLSERALFCRPVHGHQRRLRRRLAARPGCRRSARRRNFCARTWADSGRPSRDATRAPTLPADAGRRARRRSDNRWHAGATEDQAVAADPMAAVRKAAGYETQRETAVRRLYQQLTGKLP